MDKGINVKISLTLQLFSPKYLVTHNVNDYCFFVDRRGLEYRVCSEDRDFYPEGGGSRRQTDLLTKLSNKTFSLILLLVPCLSFFTFTLIIFTSGN